VSPNQSMVLSLVLEWQTNLVLIGNDVTESIGGTLLAKLFMHDHDRPINSVLAITLDRINL